MTQIKSLGLLSNAVETIGIQIKVAPACEGIISDALTNAFSHARSYFTDLFSSKKIGDEELCNLKPEYTQAKEDYRHLTPADFPVLSQAQHTGMEGFHGKYIDYSPVVINTLKKTGESFNASIKFYKILVSSIVTNKSSRGQWEDLTPRFEKSAKNRAEVIKDASQFWAEGSFASVVKINDVVSRLAELHQLDKDCLALVAELKQHDVQKTKNEVAEISDLIMILSKEIKDEKITDISSAQVKNLSTGVLELARQCEDYALAIYNAHVFLNTLKRLQKTVIDFK